MEAFQFEIESINSYGQVLVKFTPDDISLRSHAISVSVPTAVLEDADPNVIRPYLAKRSPQSKWAFEKAFEAAPVANTQHVNLTGDETDVPVEPVIPPTVEEQAGIDLRAAGVDNTSVTAALYANARGITTPLAVIDASVDAVVISSGLTLVQVSALV